jgi:hypothetical protein
MAFRARFLPKHPEKYVGDVNNIWARSTWEVTVMKWMDCRKAIKCWGSEEIAIPYLHPIDHKVHNYFPDFFVIYEKDGEEHKEIVEVKPRHESEEKYAKSERSKEALKVNEAKWKYAAMWCEERNMSFRVITEHSIYVQGKQRGKQKIHPKKS